MFMCDSTISGNCFVPEDDFKEKMPKKNQEKKKNHNFDAQVLKMGNSLVQCTNIHFNGKDLDIKDQDVYMHIDLFNGVFKEKILTVYKF